MHDDGKSALEIAKRVNWYTDPRELVDNQPMFIAHVMARGVADDIVWLHRQFSARPQREAYAAAPPGLFSRRCWA